MRHGGAATRQQAAPDERPLDGHDDLVDGGGVVVVAVGVLGGARGGQAAGRQLGQGVVGPVAGHLALHGRAALPGDVDVLAVHGQRRHQRAPEAGFPQIFHTKI